MRKSFSGSLLLFFYVKSSFPFFTELAPLNDEGCGSFYDPVIWRMVPPRGMEIKPGLGRTWKSMVPPCGNGRVANLLICHTAFIAACSDHFFFSIFSSVSPVLAAFRSDM